MTAALAAERPASGPLRDLQVHQRLAADPPADPPRKQVGHPPAQEEEPAAKAEPGAGQEHLEADDRRHRQPAPWRGADGEQDGADPQEGRAQRLGEVRSEPAATDGRR
jgi:hypothetical protein